MKLAPGDSAKAHLTVNRVKTFAGPVALKLDAVPGLEFPPMVVVPRGESGVDIEVKAAKDAAPGRRSIQFQATADVDGFEEEQRGTRIEIDVVKR